MKKVNVTVVCFTGNSGLTDYSVSLCRALAETCCVTLISAKSILRSYPGRLLAFPVAALFNRTRYYPAGVLRLVCHVLHERPQWVLFQSFLKVPLLEALLVLLLRFVLRVKVALTIHDFLPHYPKPWSRLTHKAYYSCFDKIIVHSERSLRDLRDMGVAVAARVIPHGVYDLFDIDRLGKAEALQFFPEIQEGSFVALFFGHIETRKGIFPFLEAAKASTGSPCLTFVVAGSNDLSCADRERLDAFRELGNLVIHDHRIAFEDVQRYFAAADAVVLPYLEGTTSGVLKLATTFKKPVVATKVGDISEMLSDNDGVLVDGGEGALPGAILEALIRIRRSSEEGAEWHRSDGWCWQKCGAMYHDFLFDNANGE